MQITYLIGAGASFGSLPLIKDFSAEIIRIINKLVETKKDFSFLVPGAHSVDKFELILSMIDDLTFLLNGCNAHQSVDTFAKMFFLTDQREQYDRVKRTITLFFDLYYFFEQKVDKRYDAFLASILSKTSPRFPKNVNIISWNYDYEFEKAFMKYLPNSIRIEDCYKEMNFLHKNGIHLSPQNNCRIIKINGTAGFYDINKNITLGMGCNGGRDFSFNEQSEILLFFEKYKEYKKKEYDSAISFAWEEEDPALSKLIHEIMSETQILIVIGYSFPFFNRKIDQMLLSPTICRRLSRIHIQDQNVDTIIEAVKQHRSRVNEIYHPVRSLDQFFIPMEFDIQ